MENELKKVLIPFDNCEEMCLSTASYPPRRLSLDGPLHFVTSHSRFALASMRNHVENEAPKEEAAVLEHMSEVSCECIPPKQPLIASRRRRELRLYSQATSEKKESCELLRYVQIKPLGSTNVCLSRIMRRTFITDYSLVRMRTIEFLFLS